MKYSKKALLALFTLFILALSISCVSAEDVATNDVNTVSLDETNNVQTIATTHDVKNNATFDEVQSIINSAAAGDTISFANNGEYNFGENANPLNVDKTLIFIGNNATIKCQNGFIVKAAATTTIDGTTFDDIRFENVLDSTTRWNGRAIEVQGGKDIKVINCTFLNGGNAHVYLRGVQGNVLVTDCYFYGTTNASTITPAGKGETGTKCINIMGGNGVTVTNNIVEGSALDAFSIASNSKNVVVDNNQISGAYYGIYYGGGIENVTTTNNIFKDIRAYGIGLVKASQSSDIVNNTFIMSTLPENGAYASNAAIYMEQGNTAHGAATKIGDIFIANNNFEIADDVPEDQTVYAVEIVSEAGQLKLNGNLNVNDNIYDGGITKFAFIDKTWNYEPDTGDVNIPQSSMETQIVPESELKTIEQGDKELIQLTGQDGVILPNQKVVLTIMQNSTKVETRNLVTDKFGIVTFVNNLTEGAYTIDASYAGSTYNGVIYEASSEDFSIISTGQKIVTPVIKGNSLVKYVRNASQYEFTLTADGKPLAGKTVNIFINGVPYTRTTDKDGKAIFNINLNPGNYTIHLVFLGDEEYASCASEDTVTVLSPIKANDITMKASERIPFTATILNDKGEPAIGATVDLNINGVIYHRTVQEGSEGLIKLNINLMPGEYILTAYYPLQYADKYTYTQSWRVVVTND
ncbi:MAG: Ig-like domain repeat protein [Methanobrevibacter sp.]|nr:Ig-like domain repeat protein [Methanobrevibacter sp.]